MSDTSLPALVLVHGAWHGSWCWEQLLPHLEQRGLTAVTVDLPSSGPDPSALGDLDDDVAAVTAALDATPGRKVLVGHSYGGLPVSAASAGRDDVGRLVYVCAFVLEEGQSLLEAAGGEPPAFWNIADDRASMTADDPVATFYPDVDPAAAAAAAARLGHQSLPACTAPLPAAGYRTVPSTYVVADGDTALPSFVQEAMAAGKVTEVRHLPSAHSPFLTHPAELADLLLEAARA